MKTALNVLAFITLLVFIPGRETIAQSNNRYLVLNFDCHGEASGKSNALGDSLRSEIVWQGGALVSRNLFEKLLAEKRLVESDLNYMTDKLKPLLPALGTKAAVYGHVYSSQGMLTVELRYLEQEMSEPILFDPFVCGSMKDVYAVIPDMARFVLATDKIRPRIVSVDPPDSAKNLGQYVDMKIEFSEPMNPATFSISAIPEGMWKRFGEIKYDDITRSFTFRLHLFPDTDYKFIINGERAKGFKDLAGNTALEYIWCFSTGRW